jgi:Holliday junction resolvase
MAKVIESNFWGFVKKHFDELGVLYDRIEPVSKAGIPDVNALYKGKEVWIELKSEPGLQINIKPWQTRWAQKRAKAGAHCYLLVKRKTSSYDQIELFKMLDTWKLLGVFPKEGASYNFKSVLENIFN